MKCLLSEHVFQMLIKFSFPKGSEWQNKILSSKSTNSLCFCLQVVEDMLEDEEEEDEKDDKVIISPSPGYLGVADADMTLFSPTVEKGVEVFWVQKIGQCCLSS